MSNIIIKRDFAEESRNESIWSATDELSTDVEVTLFIIRHGQTILNVMNRVQGWSDSFLTPKGEKIVKLAGKGLKEISFVAAYSSDSGRAIQTATTILNENEKSENLNLQIDERLRELNFGTYEGDWNKTMWLDVANYHGKTLEEYARNNVTVKEFANRLTKIDRERVNQDGDYWPAEDYNSMITRLKSFLYEIIGKASRKGGGNVLMISHGMTIRALFELLFKELDIPATGLDNASVSKITYKNGIFALGTINDLSHVRNG